MTYTGRVIVGGPVDTRKLPRATISKVAVGPFANNAYLVRCTATGDALLIDAAYDPGRLIEFVEDGSNELSSVRAILTTHRHHDHWQALAPLAAETGAETLAGADDVSGIPTRIDRRLRHDDVVRVGELELTIIVLRGHTPGSVALHYLSPDGSGHLFTGDALFPGGVGKTDSPAAFASLMDDVTARIFDVYGDHTWFYPGHGDDSTIGAERPRLAEWRSRGW